MDTLIIIGAGGHGKVVADIAYQTNKYKEILFLDDNASDKECLGFPIVGTSNNIKAWVSQAEFIVAIGKSVTREKVLNKLIEQKAKIATLVHPKAVVGRNVTIGYGTVVMAGVVINPDTYIGNGVIVNTSSSIDHDNVIEDYVHISVGAHLAGTVHVGSHTWIGIGATVSNNINICSGCMIGAGAVVVKDIEEGGTYVGVPAGKI